MAVEPTADQQLAGIIAANRGAILDELIKLEWANPRRPDALVRGEETVRPRATLFLDTLLKGLDAGDWEPFQTAIGQPTARLLADGIVSAEDLNQRALRVATFLMPYVLRGPDPEPAMRALFSTMQFLSSEIVGEHNRRLLAESQRLDDLKTMFLRLTGHELRAPLGTIRGYASMLEAGDLGQLVPASRSAVTAIDSAAATALGMIDRLVEVARLESGSEALHRQSHSLAAVVAGALEPLRQAAAARGVRIEEAVEDAVAEIDLDETQIALRNLVGNALKYASAGGRVAVRASIEGGDACFEVQDWGPGIAREEVDRVFDRYYRSHSSRASAVSGSGLGLYITRRIAELHGGEATVDSRPGSGATFRLRLPPAGADAGTTGQSAPGR